MLLGLALGLAGSAASAEVLTFTLDSTQSYFHMGVSTGDFETLLSSAQTPGSDQTSVSGTFNVDLTATSIQFLTTNNLLPANQAVPQAPLIDGTAGASPAQIGLNIDVPGIGGGVAALRNYSADITSPAIPLSGGGFDASNIFLAVSGGTTAFNLVLLGNPVIDSYMGGSPGLNLLSGGTLAQVGDAYTLTIPYLINNSEQVGGVDIGLVHSGVIVATAVVPEPATWLLAVTGLAAVVLVRRRAGSHAN
jgi:hypothetical protein